MIVDDVLMPGETFRSAERRPAGPRFFASAFALAATFLGVAGPGGAEPEEELPEFTDLKAPEHSYWEAPLRDPFTRFLGEMQSGERRLDAGNEKAFVASVLEALDVPASSQLLVFSKTSLQLGYIFPRNPRALYFNEEVAIGYIPGARLEVISVDPRLGAVFYIGDIPRSGAAPKFERSRRCMNCHADEETNEVPGFVIKSVIPGPNGGSLDAFRTGETGHHVPLGERFGGYYLTGKHGLQHGDHQGNRVGRYVKGEIVTQKLDYGKLFDLERYLAPGSDILAHLVHEHQAGFTNRTIEAAYLHRTLLAKDGGTLSAPSGAVLDRYAAGLVRYILFADEAKLPEGGLEGDPAFRRDFLAKRKPDSAGNALRDLDLKERLFKFPCSYMIYSEAFQSLPHAMKERVYAQLRGALEDPGRAAVRAILRETLPDIYVADR